MTTRTSHRLAALVASATVCTGLFSTVAGSMQLASLDTRPHMTLPSVTVVARGGTAASVTAQATPSVSCLNS